MSGFTPTPLGPRWGPLGPHNTTDCSTNCRRSVLNPYLRNAEHYNAKKWMPLLGSQHLWMQGQVWPELAWDGTHTHVVYWGERSELLRYLCETFLFWNRARQGFFDSVQKSFQITWLLINIFFLPSNIIGTDNGFILFRHFICNHKTRVTRKPKVWCVKNEWPTITVRTARNGNRNSLRSRDRKEINKNGRTKN